MIDFFGNGYKKIHLQKSGSGFIKISAYLDALQQTKL